MASLARLKEALDRRDRAGANAEIAALLVADAPLGAAWRSLAVLASNHGEIDLAVAAIARFADIAGTSAARHEQAVLLARSGRYDAAALVLETLGGDPAYDFTRATIALDTGRIDTATALLTTIVDRLPFAGSAWLALTTAGRVDTALGDRLIGLLSGSFEAAPVERVMAWHAAGAVFHARDEHDRAFAAFARAATDHRAILPHDRAADTASAVAATRETGTLAGGDRRGRAIFVTGLPRSGTTLVEQILAAHSGVAGGGELNLMRLVAQDARGTDAAAAERGGHEQLAGLYNHLLTQRFGADGRVVDKSLNASRMLGLVAAVLPDSPIIWIRRDPLDCAWSCFRTHFAVGAAWSLDLGDIAHHMAIEDALHARWRDRLGDRLLTVEYRALVTEPDAEVSRILAHCGLAEEHGPHAPHAARRAVTTASSVQVRRPIGRFGIGVAEPYREHLKPFADAYAALSDFGLSG